MSNKSKKNRSKNAAKQRRLNRQAEAHRQSQNQANLQNVGAALGKFAKQVGEIQKAVKEKKAQEAQNPPSGDERGVSGGLRKPDTQQLLSTPGHIVWRWNVGRSPVDDDYEAIVKLARYPRSTEPGGSFRIDVVFPEAVGGGETFDLPTAKALAEALLSAYHYPGVWEEFVGEYVANDGNAVQPLPDPPAPKPTQPTQPTQPEGFPLAAALPDTVTPLVTANVEPVVPQQKVVPIDRPKRAQICDGYKLSQAAEREFEDPNYYIDTREEGHPRCIMCGRVDVFRKVVDKGIVMKRHEYRPVPGYSAPK